MNIVMLLCVYGLYMKVHVDLYTGSSHSALLHGWRTRTAGLFGFEVSPVSRWEWVCLSNFHHVISSAPQGPAAVRGLLCTIPWHKLALLSTEFRLQKTCGVYVSVYLISASDLGHSDTGEFWSFDWTRQDVAVKVECEIILGFLPSWSKEMWQRLQVIQSIGP